jgi:hypothetical protein
MGGPSLQTPPPSVAPGAKGRRKVKSGGWFPPVWCGDPNGGMARRLNRPPPIPTWPLWVGPESESAAAGKECRELGESTRKSDIIMMFNYAAGNCLRMRVGSFLFSLWCPHFGVRVVGGWETLCWCRGFVLTRCQACPWPEGCKK